jgi:fructose-bisphosphate aldolase class II
MPLVPMRILLDHAAEHGYGLAAFNVNNMEQIQSIMEAAKETDSPVIVQASRGARSYSQDNYLRHLMLAAAELYPHIPVAMHQDHGNSPATCVSAIDNGFTSVMMDGSLKEDGKTPADFAYNSKVTAEVVKLAHARGVSVEGELGCLGSLESGHGEAEDGHGAEGALSHDQLLTDPDEAERFVAATGVDALAVAIGTSHGAYKFTRKPDGDVLAMGQIERIHKKLPNCHLVMHGSSAVPQISRTSSTSSAARCRRRGACRSRRSSAASSMACGRSTSTLTAGWRSPARSARCSGSTRRSSTRATTSSRPATP